MMKRMFAFLLAMMMLLSLTPAIAEEEPAGIATPAMDMSLEEAAELGLLSSETLPEIALEPFAPDTLDKAIIGTDDRIAVSNTSAYPYSAIAYLEVEGRCGCSWTASGFMVSKDCLMTGAHCVLCKEHNQTAGYITMYFGYKSGKNYMLKYDGETNYWYGTRVFENGKDGVTNSDWDYAFIKLRQPVGETTGWFGLSARSDSELTNGTWFEVAGYRDRVLMKDWGTANIRSQYTISHNGDTLPGYSGCPVFTSDYYVVAINVAHVTDLSGVGKYNIARRISSDLINEMRSLGMFD